MLEICFMVLDNTSSEHVTIFSFAYAAQTSLMLASKPLGANTSAPKLRSQNIVVP